ncbi:hypothetical protein ABZ128_09150 [Streptomyces sp. NPDC006326]
MFAGIAALELVILTFGTEREIRAHVDRHEDVRGMLRASGVAGPRG